MKHSGYIYRGASGVARTVRDLTAQQLNAMQLVDLPIRVEHSGADVTVGRVTRQHAVDGRGDAMIEFELNKDPSGWAVDEASRRGALRELSLKHLADVRDDGAVTRVRPTEVSVVIKGRCVERSRRAPRVRVFFL